MSGFEYQYFTDGKCLKGFLGVCFRREQVKVKDLIPFQDRIGIKKLLDAGFVLRVREKP